ncbi:glycosyltransferase family 9 protein [Actinomycetospora callitridis]|uniref:glycosyltransferase family 9 protein n=1 Tax=Actinomycetospora callitridis TaxID=913944 RepID=UPI0023671010|nr:glycosyltransferase family 9 protein [Actinomycetospora callitridis]MDD7919510.1 glycosyltransferase family 9 protein [Actinomycetospora callitridis]
MRRVLVIDLLGGLGDLIMVLPSVHALAEAHPDAELTVLTHAPGAPLLARDPAVAAVRTAEKHDERAAVEAALADLAPDLTVTTTRFDGIGDLVDTDAAARGTRAVSNLWRNPPPDELVGERYQRILAAEGAIADTIRPPRVVLDPAELAAGGHTLVQALRPRWHSTPGNPHPQPARDETPPTVLVPDAGMAVKRWPARRWAGLASSLPGPVLSIGPVDGAEELPPTDLRGLAAQFAAVAEAGGVVVGPDTGPVRLAAAVGARTVALFGPTAAARYGLEEGVNLQGLPECPHRMPTAITEQVCWWEATCPLAPEPACLLDLTVDRVRGAVLADG